MHREILVFSSIFLSLATLLQAHPGHSAFDAFAGPPHSGHAAEYLVFFLGVLAILAVSIRAILKSRD
jgi:hypothetical protein